MERENRYLVIKRSDLDGALRALLPSVKDVLSSLCDMVDHVRKARGKSPLVCVVVEHDWPEYEHTWEAIEGRIDGEHPADCDYFPEDELTG